MFPLTTETAGVCTCRHSDTQVNKRSECGFKEKIDSTLGTAKSPICIEVGVCRAVVRHTCARRLQIRRKCTVEERFALK